MIFFKVSNYILYRMVRNILYFSHKWRVQRLTLFPSTCFKTKGQSVEKNNKVEIRFNFMINLKFLNKAIECTDGNEFRVLYLIANTIGLNGNGRVKIYREVLGDKLNISPKTITRLTNSLVEKGLIKKDLVYENGKSKDFYALNLDIFGQESDKKQANFVPINASNLDRNVPLNNRNKIKQEEIELNKTLKEEKEALEEKRYGDNALPF